ncbi:MAG: GH3 auxin-responsive promoter family protein, partial [Saprospiraceae bacterium]|nr:GH3 auxin-responsive promoter family protein [Saprospiraceae bacterium]
WFVEFDNLPPDISALEASVDTNMMLQNIYYKDLVEGNILRPLVIRPLKRDAFRDYMKTQGKLGGQNKVPRLSNDRIIAEALTPYRL